MSYFIWNENDRSNVMTANGPGLALEAYQFLHGKRSGQEEIIVTKKCKVSSLIETGPQRLLQSVTDPGDIPNSKDDGKSKEAVRGQYPPLVYDDFREKVARGANDCPVVCAANIFNIEYSDAKVLAFGHGWSSTNGMQTGLIQLLAENQGFAVLFRKDLTYGRIEDFAADPPMGVYIVFCGEHVMPCVNGQLFNLQGTGWQTVDEVYEIQPRDVVDALSS